MIFLQKNRIYAAIGYVKIHRVSFEEMPLPERRLPSRERCEAAAKLNLDFLYRITRPSGLEWEDMPGFSQFLAESLDERTMGDLLKAQEINPNRIKSAFHKEPSPGR